METKQQQQKCNTNDKRPSFSIYEKLLTKRERKKKDKTTQWRKELNNQLTYVKYA